MIVPLHTTPETSVKEIDELVDVYTDVKRRWKVQVRASALVPFPSSSTQSFKQEGEGAEFMQAATDVQFFLSSKHPSC